MNIEEVDSLGLWDSSKINSFKKLFKPTKISVVFADTHIGSIRSLGKPNYETMTGQTIKLDSISSKLYSCWQKFNQLANQWKADSVYFLGDAISATSTKLGSWSRDYLVSIDEQKEMANQLLKPMFANREGHMISGTPFHDGQDNKIHYDLAKVLNAKFYPEGYILDSIDKVPILMAHIVRTGSQYPLGIMQRSLTSQDAAIQRKRIEEVKWVCGGHYHQYSEVNEGSTITVLPGWQGFYALKGNIANVGKHQPDIGGLILLVRRDKLMTIPYVFKIRTMG